MTGSFLSFWKRFHYSNLFPGLPKVISGQKKALPLLPPFLPDFQIFSAAAFQICLYQRLAGRLNQFIF